MCTDNRIEASQPRTQHSVVVTVVRKHHDLSVMKKTHTFIYCITLGRLETPKWVLHTWGQMWIELSSFRTLKSRIHFLAFGSPQSCLYCWPLAPSSACKVVAASLSDLSHLCLSSHPLFWPLLSSISFPSRAPWSHVLHWTALGS